MMITIVQLFIIFLMSVNIFLSDSNCCSEPVSYAAVEEDGTSGLVIEFFFMTWIRFVLMLYFFMVAYKAACQTLLKAFLKSMKTW